MTNLSPLLTTVRRESAGSYACGLCLRAALYATSSLLVMLGLLSVDRAQLFAEWRSDLSTRRRIEFENARGQQRVIVIGVSGHDLVAIRLEHVSANYVQIRIQRDFEALQQAPKRGYPWLEFEHDVVALFCSCNAIVRL